MRSMLWIKYDLWESKDYEIRIRFRKAFMSCMCVFDTVRIKLSGIFSFYLKSGINNLEPYGNYVSHWLKTITAILKSTSKNSQGQKAIRSFAWPKTQKIKHFKKKS